ncbi:hypothetical protein, conserved [Babesia bigemina]|uniref:Uncharacterized protein n=1 Tax=Babesia bigemina TaxID=5866 RepID=A0A061DEN0_BABBI|nr:hypothetical protein, conserved [Babesia bigemina]CDR97565.1 hypothetical protein, conserved [Babesia bigemina]|eukprot:XP_012769751.1 hypothetical protein, conserved [Babesia bigemina]
MARLVSATQEKADKLLVYLARKIGEHKPRNVVFFIVDILCTYYPRHIPNFSKTWLMDKNLDEAKQHVRELFKRNNSTSCIAQHFINAGFDSVSCKCDICDSMQVDSLTCLTTDVLDEIQAYNNTTWLPGHKVRVYQIFKDIKKVVKEYKDSTRSSVMVWQHGDNPVYAQMEGAYITPSQNGASWLERRTVGTSGGPVYYYSQRQTASSLTTINPQSTIHKTSSSLFDTVPLGHSYNGPVIVNNDMTVTQIANKSAEATTNKIIYGLMAKTNAEQPAVKRTGASICCHTYESQ